MKREVVGKLMRVQDVIGFFDNDIAPANLEAKVEKRTALNLLGQRKIPMDLIMVFFMMMIIGTVAYVIVSGQMNSSGTANALADCKYQLGQQNARVVTSPAVTNPGEIITQNTNANAGIGIK